MGFSRKEYWSGLPFPSPMHAGMLSRFSHVRLCVTLWTEAHQTPLPTGFSRQEYWSGFPFPSPHKSAGPQKYCKLKQDQNKQTNKKTASGQISVRKITMVIITVKNLRSSVEKQ